MQAHITATGMLELRAENPTEAYALRTWWESPDGAMQSLRKNPWPPASGIRCDWDSCSSSASQSPGQQL